MTVRPILSRFARLRSAFRGSRTARSFNLTNVFLVCCLAADSPDGILATSTAEQVGMCVKNARDLLTRLVTLGLLTRRDDNRHGGRPAGIFSPTPALFMLLGVEQADTKMAEKCQLASGEKSQ